MQNLLHKLRINCSEGCTYWNDMVSEVNYMQFFLHIFPIHRFYVILVNLFCKTGAMTPLPEARLDCIEYAHLVLVLEMSGHICVVMGRGCEHPKVRATWPCIERLFPDCDLAAESRQLASLLWPPCGCGSGTCESKLLVNTIRYEPLQHYFELEQCLNICQVVISLIFCNWLI